MPDQEEPTPAYRDYDEDPERFRLGRENVHRYGLAGDVHEDVAERFEFEGFRRVLDIGCGEGELRRYLSSARWLGIDRSNEMLRRAPQSRVKADACQLPIRDASFDGAAALYVLYHLAGPLLAVREAFRVLRVGGLFAAAAPSRHDSPEFAPFLPDEPPSTFDAEIAPDLVASIFPEVEVHSWDAPLVELPEPDAVVRYLRGRGISVELAQEIAQEVETPLRVTKRGALVYGRKHHGASLA